MRGRLAKPGNRLAPLGDLHMTFKPMLGLLAAATMSLTWTGGAVAQQTVKIGAIFPLSGNAASAGVHAKAAIEVAIDIINNDHPELGDFPLAKGAGLPGLGGAKVEVVFADNQGSPATGQNQALRLITEEKVVALTGAYQSGVTLTVSQITEKYGIPFVNGESVAAGHTERQVLQLKEKKPDVVIMITYTSDAILFAKTMQAQDYKPPMLLADDAGYSDPSFLKAAGNISVGAFNRSSWSVGKPGSPTAIIAKMYKDKI